LPVVSKLREFLVIWLQVGHLVELPLLRCISVSNLENEWVLSWIDKCAGIRPVDLVHVNNLVEEMHLVVGGEVQLIHFVVVFQILHPVLKGLLVHQIQAARIVFVVTPLRQHLRLLDHILEHAVISQGPPFFRC